LRVGVIGDIYVDLLCKVDELPVWGEDRLASATPLSPGGSTANPARFLGRPGGPRPVDDLLHLRLALLGTVHVAEQVALEGLNADGEPGDVQQVHGNASRDF